MVIALLGFCALHIAFSIMDTTVFSVKPITIESHCNRLLGWALSKANERLHDTRQLVC